MEAVIGILSALCVPLLVVAVLVAGFFSQAIKIVREYERAVVFRLGRVKEGAKGPGLIILIPVIENMRKVDLRVDTLDLPAQEAITRDNVTVKVNAVVLMRVTDPNAAVLEVQDYRRTVFQIAQTTLRAVLGQSDLDEILANREAINDRLREILDRETEPWGVEVTIVEVKDVELPQSMQRAMARQAEAEREKRAKIIHAQGEFAAAQQLSEAAELMSRTPAALQLRYLQTLGEIAVENHSTLMTFLPPQEYMAGLGEAFARGMASGQKSDKGE